MKPLLLLLSLCAIPAGAGPVTKETRQLTVSLSASAETLTGGPVKLTLDIELKPRVHVYAPGVERYIAIDWTMSDSSIAKAKPVVWPKAEKLHLDAIDETVPVYTGRFRLSRNIAVTTGAKGGARVTGVLKYQACDDRMCYKPESLPLEWTFY